MATVVNDTFTESSNTALTSHTPDTGTGWTQIYNNMTSGYAQVNATTDYCEPTANENNKGLAYASSPDPASAEYDVTVVMGTAHPAAETYTKPFGVFGRHDGTADDRYILQVLPDSHTQNAYQLYKVDGGVETQLASVDGTTVAGDEFKLEVRNASKKVYKNGSEILSSTDNVLTAAGKVGIAWGSWCPGGAHVDVDSRFTSYKVETVVTTVSAAVMTVGSSIPSVTVSMSGGSSQIVSADVLQLATSLPSATIVPGGITVAATPLVGVLTMPASVVTSGQIVHASTLVISVINPVGTIVPGPVTVSPSPLDVSVSVPPVTITSGVVISAHVLQVATALQPVTVTLGALVVTPEPLVITVSLLPLLLAHAVPADVTISDDWAHTVQLANAQVTIVVLSDDENGR